MTELLEQRLAAVFEAVDQGIVVQADAQFMKEIILSQNHRFTDLSAELNEARHIIGNLETKIVLLEYFRGFVESLGGIPETK